VGWDEVSSLSEGLYSRIRNEETRDESQIVPKKLKEATGLWTEIYGT
jgi:hypothetical protein